MKYTYRIYEGPLNTLMIELPEKISLVADLNYGDTICIDLESTMQQ